MYRYFFIVSVVLNGVYCSSDYGTLVKDISLTPLNDADNGASIDKLPGTEAEIMTTDTKWEITSKDRIKGTMDMLINLDSSWGFDTNHISTIEITMYGSTPISKVDADLIVSFSVDSSEYFSTTIKLDNGVTGFGGNTISACTINSATPTAPLLLGNVNELVNDVNDNRLRLAKASAIVQPLLPKTAENEWPLKFTLTNDPINNFLFIKYEGTPQQKCGFQAFQTGKGLQIYLAADNAGEVHTFSQFDLKYYIDLKQCINNNQESELSENTLIIIFGMTVLIILLILNVINFINNNKYGKEMNYLSVKHVDDDFEAQPINVQNK